MANDTNGTPAPFMTGWKWWGQALLQAGPVGVMCVLMLLANQDQRAAKKESDEWMRTLWLESKESRVEFGKITREQRDYDAKEREATRHSITELVDQLRTLELLMRKGKGEWTSP